MTRARVVASGIRRRKEQRGEGRGEERQARCVVENRRGCGGASSQSAQRARRSTPKSVETWTVSGKGVKGEERLSLERS